MNPALTTHCHVEAYTPLVTVILSHLNTGHSNHARGSLHSQEEKVKDKTILRAGGHSVEGPVLFC